VKRALKKIFGSKRRAWRRMPSCGMLGRVAVVKTDVSEEHIASISG
jgi:hypothetical protein